MSCRCGPCRVGTGEAHYCDAQNDALVSKRREDCPRCLPMRRGPSRPPAPAELEAFVGALRERFDEARAREGREGYTREAIAARQRAFAVYAAAREAAHHAGFRLAPVPAGAAP